MRRDTRVPPYRNTLQSRARMPCRVGAACRGGRPCPPGAVDFHKVRRAACPHAAVMVRWLSGGGLRAARPTGGLQEVRCAAGHTGPALQKYFAKQGPCALPWVRERNPPVTALPCQPPLGRGPWGRGCGLPQPVTQYRKCVERNDVGIGPYEVFTDRIS